MLWFCPDDHEKWLSENYNLVEYQTKFADKISQFEKQDPFLRNGYFPYEISFRFESCVGSRTLIIGSLIATSDYLSS